MTNRQDMLELAARAEAATGPDRELDRAIAKLITPIIPFRHLSVSLRDLPEWDGDRVASGSKYVPFYTASLDAAMSLVPEGCCFQVTDYDTFARVFNDERGLCGSAEGYTPALALTAASLKARAHTKGEE